MKPDLLDSKGLVDYAKSLDCIHCGLCLQTCPTYRLSGVETSSPRGRIHLMRAVGEGRLEPDAAYSEELDFCLLCRHCESVCPAGVHFGQMMETARSEMQKKEKRPWLGAFALQQVLPSRLMLRLVGSLLRFAQAFRLDGIGARLAGSSPDSVRKLPRIPPLPARPLLPKKTEPEAGTEKRGEVCVLQGCVQAEFFANVNRATVRSLAALGYGSRVPEALVCCGSLHAHNGDREGARKLARVAIEVLEKERDGEGRGLPLVVNSAGCGSHLKELSQLFPEDDPWHERAAALEERVVDYAEFVAPLIEQTKPCELPEGLLPGPLTWDDPCHLCHGQQIRSEPRSLLAALAPDRVVPLEGSESCCGSAGVYSMVRPDDAGRVFDGKREAFERSGAGTLVTANPGCQIQWTVGLRDSAPNARVVHLAELVEAALAARNEKNS